MIAWEYMLLKIYLTYLKKKKKIVGSKILIMGVAFKENCTDSRNYKIFDTINLLKKNGAKVFAYDPLVPIKFLRKKTNNVLTKIKFSNYYDAVIIAVPHEEFLSIGISKIKKIIKRDGLILDLKSIFPKNQTDWQL